MEASTSTQRAVLAGLSCGVGFAIPVVTYAVSSVLGEPSSVVSSNAVPFAIGSVAGVGILTAAQVLDEVRDAQSEQAAEDYDRLTKVSSERSAKRSAARAAAAKSVSPYGIKERERTVSIPREEVLKSAERTHRGPAALIERFKRNKAEDIPVIARAEGAPSENDAWDMIDEMNSSDVPYSCDASEAKDMYQIAIDELSSDAAKTGTMNSAYVEDAMRAAAGLTTPPAGTTATFINMAAAAAQNAAQAASQQTCAADVPMSAQSAQSARAQQTDLNRVSVVEAAVSARNDAEDAARDAALASLGNPVAAPSVRPVTLNASAEPIGKIGVARSNAVASAASSQAQWGQVSVDSAAPVSFDRVVQTTEDVPMADYSGHEDMWAQAVAILDGKQGGSTPFSAVSCVRATPSSRQIPRIDMTADTPASLSVTSAMDATELAHRAEAVAEGVRAKRVHSRINEILNEEVERLNSKSLQRSNYVYLRVIQGGTAPIPMRRARLA